ncbi:thermonuclease family protein [Corynebacterium flavescens]|uniref:thermonuclease family protein n=1 Tax=Corynebacterium flavescens TaxID=28028 RepID=UPI003FD387F3
MGFFKCLLGSLAIVAVGTGGYVAYDKLSHHPITVDRVIDGDTIDVAEGDEVTRIRLLNIDTPELGHEGRPSECLAEDAKAFLDSLLPRGTEVRLEYDEERTDKYGRTLAGVYVDDGLINSQVAAAGLATPLLIEPNHRFYPEVLSAAETAEGSEKGIFALGPECFVSDPQAGSTLQQARSDLDAANDDFPRYLRSDEDFNKAIAKASATKGALNKLQGLSRRNLEQSDFQKAAYGTRFQDEVQETLTQAREQQAAQDKPITKEKERREEELKLRKEQEEREAERARVAEEAKQREAANAATSRDLQAGNSTASSPASTGSTSNSTGGNRAGNGSDGYTGCRAYGGNYAMTSIDAQGRSYAKIDCSTRIQIG